MSIVRQMQGQARLADMLETTRAVKGDAFHAVALAALQAHVAMRAYDGENADVRLQAARSLMDVIRYLAQALALPPGHLAEALKHARAMYRAAL